MQIRVFFVVVACFVYFATSSIVWDGNFNDYANSAALDQWSFSNQVGEYQCYIYGNGNGQTCSTWVHVDPSYKNPIESLGNKGARFEINGNSRWNNDAKLRTEMIPNLPSSQYQRGTLYYKWSMKMDPQNPLLATNEHQLVFFEAHFCDLKYGGSGGAQIQFWANGNKVWGGDFTAGVWYNFAFEVNYDAQTCAFYSNPDGKAYVNIVAPIRVSASTSDFHVGILRLPDSNQQQNPTSSYLYYSGVYVETTLSTSNFNSAIPSNPTTAHATTARATTAQATTAQATTARATTAQATTAQATTARATTAQATTARATTAQATTARATTAQATTARATTAQATTAQGTTARATTAQATTARATTGQGTTAQSTTGVAATTAAATTTAPSSTNNTNSTQTNGTVATTGVPINERLTCSYDWQCPTQPNAFCNQGYCDCHYGFENNMTNTVQTPGCYCSSSPVWLNGVPWCLKGLECIFDWNCGWPIQCVVPQGQTVGVCTRVASL